MEEKDFITAVKYLRQVHAIDAVITTNSEDYQMILNYEESIKNMIRNEFHEAITANDTNQGLNYVSISITQIKLINYFSLMMKYIVMKLVPLLQTLGLENEAREDLLTFMESKVFIIISADNLAQNLTSSTVEVTAAYAETLANIFNESVLILQRHLPMIIQGLDTCQGMSNQSSSHVVYTFSDDCLNNLLHKVSNERYYFTSILIQINFIAVNLSLFSFVILYFLYF